MHQFLIILADLPGRIYWFIAILGIPLLIFVIFTILRLPNWARLNFLSFRQRIINKLVETDPHPPVLYLRPFNVDGTTTQSREFDFSKIKSKINIGTLDLKFSEVNFEYQLAQKAEKLGPFIAIGNPRGGGQNFGAARTFYSDEEWKQNALKKMKKSCMILMRPSNSLSEGFTWEFELIIANYLKKTIFFLESARNSLNSELYRKLQEKYKNISDINNAPIPCYVEFLDNNQIAISKNISQTSLYRDLYHLSKINKHYMYCANCGEANKSTNTYCVGCSNSLKTQKLNRVKKRFNPFISFITSDGGFLSMAILYFIAASFWFYFETTGNNEAHSVSFKTARVVSLTVSVITWLIMIFFTVKVWRQIVITIIALLLLSREFYYVYKDLFGG